MIVKVIVIVIVKVKGDYDKIMNSEYPTLSVLDNDDIVVATCTIPILEFEHDEEGAWEHDMDQVLSHLNGRFLIVDFSQVNILSSSALQYLIKLLFLSRKENLKFGLCGFCDNIKRVLQVTRLADMFVIAASIEETKKLLRGAHETNPS